MWSPLLQFDDSAIPKIHNLARAQAAGFRVPQTFWLKAASVAKPRVDRPRELATGPLILRSGSPTEDTRETSNAGQLLSLPCRAEDDFDAQLRRVIAALPRDSHGSPLGAVFVQPLLAPEAAGVAFFDGFYYERTLAAGSNEGLTSGQARGEVERGHFQRGETWSSWLEQLWRLFGADGDAAIDIEFARDESGYVLLQSRPALFALQRNPTLSLANHKEILGDCPSPWIISVLLKAGRSALDYYAAVDPRIAGWDEQYAIGLGERAWMNFSFFFRLMDHWGLPRKFVIEGVGGSGGSEEDGKPLWGRFFGNAHRLMLLQVRSLIASMRIEDELEKLDRQIDEADGLEGLHAASVAAMELAIRSNFAINSVLTAVAQVRRFLGIRGEAEVVTKAMMDQYNALRSMAADDDRERALDSWLTTYGHRGPLESDPMQPRFVELREKLAADLRESLATPTDAPDASTTTTDAKRPLWLKPVYWIDERREWFRDQLMRRWQRLRTRILARAEMLVADGKLAAVNDVFMLAAEDCAAPDLDAAVVSNKQRRVVAQALSLPDTDSRDSLMHQLDNAALERAQAAGRSVFPGIALSDAVVEGTVCKAHSLTELLGTGVLREDTILVVAALEPSWAVVFPRVRGVVAQIGGELSHASILLREARRPAIVNCSGIFGRVESGDRLRLDGVHGQVEILDA